MPTYAELSSKLLFEASHFFKTLAEQDENLKERLEENAKIFEQVGQLIQEDPMGTLEDNTHASIAARLMTDAATFFRSIGEQNEPIKEQMEMNASVYEQLAERLATNPLEEIEAPPEAPPAE